MWLRPLESGGAIEQFAVASIQPVRNRKRPTNAVNEHQSANS